MGIFGMFFKSSDTNTSAVGIKDDLLEFLKNTDKLYMEAYSLKSTKEIAHSLSPQCARKLASAICSINARYFGDDKYRRTTWTCKSVLDSTYTIEKDVKFDNVKVAGKLSIAIADNYKEIWTIERGRSYVLTNIVPA